MFLAKICWLCVRGLTLCAINIDRLPSIVQQRQSKLCFLYYCHLNSEMTFNPMKWCATVKTESPLLCCIFSPFTTTVQPAVVDARKVAVSGVGVRPQGVPASLPISFKVDTREAGQASLDVVVQVRSLAITRCFVSLHCSCIGNQSVSQSVSQSD